MEEVQVVQWSRLWHQTRSLSKSHSPPATQLNNNNNNHNHNTIPSRLQIYPFRSNISRPARHQNLEVRVYCSLHPEFLLPSFWHLYIFSLFLLGDSPSTPSKRSKSPGTARGISYPPISPKSLKRGVAIHPQSGGQMSMGGGIKNPPLVKTRNVVSAEPGHQQQPQPAVMGQIPVITGKITEAL